MPKVLKPVKGAGLWAGHLADMGYMLATLDGSKAMSSLATDISLHEIFHVYYGYHSPDRKNSRLLQIILQAICRTNAHILSKILHENHVQKMNYSMNKKLPLYQKKAV